MIDNYILCGGLTPCVQRNIRFKDFQVGEVNRAIEVVESVGGKQINVARMIKSLGGNVQTIGFCGGANGRKVQELLEQEDLLMTAVETIGNTRICQTLISESVTELVEEMPPVLDSEIENFITAFNELRKNAQIVTLTGTLPASVPSDLYCKLLDGFSGFTILDTSGAALKNALKMSPFLVKLNESEMTATFGSIERGISEIFSNETKWVLVTRGANGATLFSKSKKIEIPPYKVNALNPIGSGDATTAGIAFVLSQNLTELNDEKIIDAVKFGLACGAAQTETFLSGVLDVSRVREILKN